MVAESRVVIMARTVGRSARSATDRSSVHSRWVWKLRNAATEFCRSRSMPTRACCCTACSTASNVARVSVADTATMESRNLVRSRIPFMRKLQGFRVTKFQGFKVASYQSQWRANGCFAWLEIPSPKFKAQNHETLEPYNPATLLLWHKLVSRAMHRPEIYWVRAVFFQLLPQPQYVVIHCPRARIIFVTPHLVQQFLPRQHALRILDHELQHLEFLRGHRHKRSVPPQFHLREVHLDVAKAERVGYWSLRRTPPHRGSHAGQQFARTEGLGHSSEGSRV